MVLLSLDQSSKCSGYAVFVDEKLLTYGKFTFTDQDIDARLVKIRNKIKELIDQYKPNHVIYEDIQQQNNVANNIQTFKVLAEVYGIISELLEELAIPHSTVISTSWKSTLGIKGRTRQEQKQNAQQHVVDTYGIQVTQDIADAICIGEHYLKQNQNQCAWTK